MDSRETSREQYFNLKSIPQNTAPLEKDTLPYLPKFLNISMNNQQQPCLQRYLCLLLREDITHAPWLPKVQYITMQRIIQPLSTYTSNIACQWEQREQIVNLPFDTCTSWPTQEPADRW